MHLYIFIGIHESSISRLAFYSRDFLRYAALRQMSRSSQARRLLHLAVFLYFDVSEIAAAS